MRAEAEEFAEKDGLIRQVVEARNQLESSALSLKSTLEDGEKFEGLPDEDQETLQEAVEEVLSWLEDNPNENMEELEDYLEDLKERQVEFDEVVQPIFGQAGGSHGSEDYDS